MEPYQIFLQQIINGLAIGVIYALIALGYTMVYGVIQLINFAHGEVFMVGAYLGLTLFTMLGLPPEPSAWTLLWFLPLMVVFAAAGCGLLGLVIDRVAYRPVRNAPRLVPLITAIGVSFVLQNVVMLVYGAADKSFPPLFPQIRFTWANVSVTLLQIFILIVSLALMIGLHLFVRHTRWGKAMRACSDDLVAARVVGIPVNKTIAMAFFIGSCMAGAGGVLFGMYYNTINFHDGYLAGLKAFTAAVLGGIGNIPGAMLGGILIGVLEGLGAGYLSSEWKNVFAFVILILILLVRPSGLLGERVAKKA